MIWYNLSNELSLSWVMSEDVVCVVVLRPFLCCGLVLVVRVDHTALMISLESDLCLLSVIVLNVFFSTFSIVFI